MPYYPLPGGASYVSVFSFIHLYLSINRCPTVHQIPELCLNRLRESDRHQIRCIVLNTEITHKLCQNSIPIVQYHSNPHAW